MPARAARTEAELVAAAARGEAAALDALIVAVQPRIYRFARRMCSQPEDAEDVLQDTLLTLARRIGDFRGEASLSTYLYTVARSHCLKMRRTSKYAPTHRAPAEHLAQLPSSEDLQASAANREAWGLVAAALRALPPDQREVLVLRDIEELSAAEVAEVVDSSVGAVKSRLHRARKALREGLAASTREALGPPTPRCPDIAVAHSQHLEGELGAETCAIMEAHVTDCPRCKSICDGLRADLATCQEAPQEPVPQALQARIRAMLADLAR